MTSLIPMDFYLHSLQIITKISALVFLFLTLLIPVGALGQRRAVLTEQGDMTLLITAQNGEVVKINGQAIFSIKGVNFEEFDSLFGNISIHLQSSARESISRIANIDIMKVPDTCNIEDVTVHNFDYNNCDDIRLLFRDVTTNLAGLNAQMEPFELALTKIKTHPKELSEPFCHWLRGLTMGLRYRSSVAENIDKLLSKYSIQDKK